MTQEQEELFRRDPLIKLLLETEAVGTIEIVGGAVVDILEGRKVKDYDFKLVNGYIAERLKLEYLHETKTAKTFKKGDIVVQFLKTNPENFDFKISQATLIINVNKKMSLNVDKISFNNKILIPCDLAWENRKNAVNSLKRITHWKKKGYSIADETYQSLLNVISKNFGEKS